MSEFSPSTFASEGAHCFSAALTPWIGELEAALAELNADEPGVRIRHGSAIRSFLVADGCIGSIAVRALGKEVHAVRAILFDKTLHNNWSLGWHQDRTICVKQRREVAGFGPWTTKAGMQHVAPPASLLARMVTVRAHLDDVPVENAPLLIAPGSHLFGRVPEGEINTVVQRCGIEACLAQAGDVWLYSTLILHASEPALLTARRRVLQIDYAAEPLPGGLEWFGV